MAAIERLVIESGKVNQPFNYAVGMHGSKFFAALKEKTILGIKCPGCKKVYVPPRKVCGRCFKEMNEFVKIGPGGVIGTYTILRYQFLDPETGERRPVPFGYGFIKLDGADTLFQHYIDIKDESALKIGARVEPVFTDKPKGSIRDIVHFRVVE